MFDAVEVELHRWKSVGPLIRMRDNVYYVNYIVCIAARMVLQVLLWLRQAATIKTTIRWQAP